MMYVSRKWSDFGSQKGQINDAFNIKTWLLFTTKDYFTQSVEDASGKVEQWDLESKNDSQHLDSISKKNKSERYKLWRQVKNRKVSALREVRPRATPQEKLNHCLCHHIPQCSLIVCDLKGHSGAALSHRVLLCIKRQRRCREEASFRQCCSMSV